MSIEIVTRVALGNVVPLGTLYDSRTNQFLEGVSVIRRDIPDAAKQAIQAGHSDVEYLYSDSISEKFARLNVNGELQISILLGLVTLGGSGSYLNYPKTSATSIQSSLVYKIRTKTERLNVFHPDLKQELSLDALRLSPGSSHFVSQIHWGANSVLVCEYVNKLEGNETDIEEKVRTMLESAGKAIQRPTDVTFPPDMFEKNPCHQLRIFGDILPNDVNPDTPEAAVNLLRQVTSLINATDSGWGVPVSYTLLPTSILSGSLKDDMDIAPVGRQLDLTTVTKIFKFLESMIGAQKQLFDFHAAVNRFQYCLLPAEVTQVFTYKNLVDIDVATLKSNLSDIIDGVKMNRLGPENVDEFLLMFNNRDCASDNIAKKISGWSNIKRKIHFAKRLISRGIKYLQNDWALEEVIQENSSKKLLVFYIYHDLETATSNWRKNTQLFFNQILTGRDEQDYIVVDCAYQSCPQNKTISFIQVIQRGVVINEDLLADQKAFLGHPVAELLGNAKRLPTEKSSIELYPFNTHCPGKSCDQAAKYNWTCTRCGKILQIGSDDMIHCDCGMTHIQNVSYKCSDPRHGFEFDKQEPDYLESMITSHHRMLYGSHPKDCMHIRNVSTGTVSSGIYTIYPYSNCGDQREGVKVYCDMDTDGGGWTVFQRRMDATDFYRGWDEYTVGFGNKSGSHWLGLNTLAALTKEFDSELRVDLEDWNGAKGFAVYKSFHVGTEADKFRLGVSGYSGNIGDSLEYHNGMAFSTKDNDNDKDSGICAQHTHGAWWYNSCMNSNLNGLYYTSAVAEDKCASWWYWKRKYISLKQTEMKIRRR